jgi:hypothetical protein
MDDRKQEMRCRAKKLIRTHAAVIGPLNEGTITDEVESLGRNLILVQWDAGLSTYVFDDEIEIIARKTEAGQCN